MTDHNNKLVVFTTHKVCPCKYKPHKQGDIFYDISEKQLFFYKERKCYPIAKNVINIGGGIKFAHNRGNVIIIKTITGGNGIAIEDLDDNIKISATPSNNTFQTTTFNNHPQILMEIPLSNGTSMALNLLIIGARKTTGESSSFLINTIFKNVFGTITHNPSPDTAIISDVNDRQVFFTTTLSTVKVIVQGTDTDGTVNWSGDAKIQKVDF